MSLESHWNETDEDLPNEGSIIPFPALLHLLSFKSHDVSTRLAPTDISKVGTSLSSEAVLSLFVLSGKLLTSVEIMWIFETKHIDLTADPPTCSPSNFEEENFLAPDAYLKILN